MTATTALTAPIPVPDADPRRERRGATEYRIRYCSRCVMPETRPDILFDADGVCSACRHYDQRPTIDWDARHRELLALLDEYRDTSGTKYDCVVPVSGGKDSTYQVLRVKQLGLNPLCVTATTCLLSDIGRRNIENLKRIGVDYVEVTTNPQVRRRINRLALRQVGDISWPEHASIFTVPVRVAVQYGVRLIVWGENSQNEYGGPASAADDRVLNRRWLEEFGGLIGMRVSDLVGQDGIEARDLIQYTYPSDDDLQRVGVTGIFLGHYLPWDGFANALLAQGHGFESWPSPVEGALLNYENLDNLFHGIHDYFKFLKFGFGRATDHACMHVRRGRLSRSDAATLVQRHDGKFPWTYLGEPLERFLTEIDVTLDEFHTICDRFTNRKLFLTNRAGELQRDAHGNLARVNEPE
jgi:N-acetyl sugar amidotransferase